MKKDEQKIKVKFDPTLVLSREQSQKLAELFRDVKEKEIEKDLIESVRLVKKYPDESTRDHECPISSPYCRTHFQKLRCMEGKHMPDSVPKVEIKIFHRDGIRMEMKIYMEGQPTPIAFSTIQFEDSDGARAFADALEEHGVIGYAVYLDR